MRDTRHGKNGVHTLVGVLRQSNFGRLAGYPDVNDTERLARDPLMRQIVGGRAVDGQAASTSQMARFEADILASAHNLAALAASVTTRCLCSTSSAILSAAPCPKAMPTAPMAGRMFWHLSSPATKSVT